MTNSHNKDNHNSNHTTHKDSNITHKDPIHDNHENKKSPILPDNSNPRKPVPSNPDDVIKPKDHRPRSEDSDEGSTIRSDKGTSDEDELNDTLTENLNDKTINKL